MLPALPPTFAATRESLRALACYAVSPARKARTGRIGLRSHEGGIATPPFEDGRRISVRGDQLMSSTGETAPITTVSAAAQFLGVDLSPDPGVGHDLPPFNPDAELAVDREASLVLGAWYEYADQVLGALAASLPGDVTVSEAQLWPEHFDLAVVVTVTATVAATGAAMELKADVGFSPGDVHSAEPYAYVGPYDRDGLDRRDGYWNAPFGSSLGYRALSSEAEPDAAALRFIEDGLGRLRRPPA